MSSGESETNIEWRAYFASDRKDRTVERRIINPWTWQDQMGYVQANEVSGTQRTLLCAGQTSVDEEGRPVHAGDMGAQLAQALDNLETVLGAAGAALSDVMRLNIYTTDVDLFFEAYGPPHGWRRPAVDR